MFDFAIFRVPFKDLSFAEHCMWSAILQNFLDSNHAYHLMKVAVMISVLVAAIYLLQLHCVYILPESTPLSK